MPALIAVTQEEQDAIDAHAARGAERADRLRGRAAAKSAESTSRFNRAMGALAPIPPGQPILVGHHSERKHRNAIERSDQNILAMGIYGEVSTVISLIETCERAIGLRAGRQRNADQSKVDEARRELAGRRSTP